MRTFCYILNKKIKLTAMICLLAVTGAFAQSNPAMKWFNQPSKWAGNAASLTFTVDPGTDYWQVTHYGFKRDNGPFYYQEMAGNFEASVKITGSYHELFHQAGLWCASTKKTGSKPVSNMWRAYKT